jgi:hypothetical protein
MLDVLGFAGIFPDPMIFYWLVLNVVIFGINNY